MAVPTVVNIIPAEAPVAGRKIIEIYGNNFRMPSDLPPGDVTEPSPNSVEVLFDGVAGTVEVISPILLRVYVPVSPISGKQADNFGAGTVDVEIRNVDDNGVLIAGETLTLADGFTYRQVGLDSVTSSQLATLVASMILDMRKQVIPEVVLEQSTEYDGDTSDGLNITQIAEVPAIVLNGPALTENRFYSLNTSRFCEQPDGTFLEMRHPYTVDLTFEVVGIANSTHQLLNMMALFVTYMRRNKFFDFGTNRYEFDFVEGGEPEARTNPNNSNLRSFSGTIVLRGFDIEGFAGFTNDDVVGIQREVINICFDLSKS